ncbi:Clock-controlled protein 6 [Erysiphe neolycopersici]|uniref:Clock-controlled protein 6 n=1 Tax=Erysiphe neolycopersici TaxID=212602 RepID=A0A420HML2_9PEZI|nr:Clock-controlled protein 6 [Erysiphe neolycopersici]
MRFSVATVFALASTISAAYNATNVYYSTVYITEVHTAYTTFCPNSTELVYNGVTYTATKESTITITNCPCTVVKPVVTTTSVVCLTCDNASPDNPLYGNNTMPKPVPTGAYSPKGINDSPVASPTHITTSNAGRLLVLSSASMAVFLCSIALFL